MVTTVRLKTRTCWDESIHNPMVCKYHARGQTDPEIAKSILMECGMEFSAPTVQYKRQLLGLAINPIPKTVGRTIEAKQPSNVALENKNKPLLSKMLLHMNGRFSFARSLELDGKPVTLAQAVREYNRSLVKEGLPQFDKNPNWIVPCP